MAHALVVAKSKVDGDPNYSSYRRGCKIRPVVDSLLETTGIDLWRGGGVLELMRFQEHFRVQDRRFRRIKLRGIMFDGQVESENRINLVYDDVNKHFHVIILRVRWLEGMYAEAVIRDVNAARLISAERRVATASRFLLVRLLKNESRASPVTEAFEVARISKNIRQTSLEAKRLSAKRWKIVPCVTCG